MPRKVAGSILMLEIIFYILIFHISLDVLFPVSNSCFTEIFKYVYSFCLNPLLNTTSCF